MSIYTWPDISVAQKNVANSFNYADALLYAISWKGFRDAMSAVT